MKKILILEGQAEYREKWANFFAEYGPYLDVEVEIPDKISDFPALIGRMMIERAYFILDDDISELFSERVLFSGHNIAGALEVVGFHSKILLSFERDLYNEDVIANIHKYFASTYYRLKSLCFVSSLLSGVSNVESYYRVYDIVKSQDVYCILDTPEKYDYGVSDAANLAMQVWFKKR